MRTELMLWGIWPGQEGPAVSVVSPHPRGQAAGRPVTEFYIIPNVFFPNWSHDPSPKCCQMFAWKGPHCSRKQEHVFPGKPAAVISPLTTIEGNLHGLGRIYFGSLRAGEPCTEINL